MGLISDLFDGKKSIDLAKSPIYTGEPVSKKETPEIVRVKQSELEQAYISDPVCFNSINKATQMIMAAGYTIEGEGSEEFIKFLSEIGNVGDDITWDEMLEAIFKYQMIYGWSFIESVFNKKQDRIVDLTLIDSKRMDYAKNGSDKIVLDRFGKPVGYTLQLQYGTTAEGDPIPNEFRNSISTGSDKIFMMPKRICQFKLYTYGDRFYPLGLIEPGYKSVLRKMNIEEAQANSIYTRGTYPVIAYVGDQMHDPTPQDIDSVLKNLTRLKHDRYTAFQYWVKVDTLEAKQSDIVQSTLDYLRLNETASLGMPTAFATGAGEATNRATLNNQQVVLEFTLNDIVNRTVATIEKYIFKRIAFYNGYKGVPKLKWGTIRADEPNDQAMRLINYVKNGILNPEDITAFARKSEGI